MRFLERHELVSRMEWLLRLGAVGMSCILAPTLLGTVCLLIAEYAPHVDEVLRFLFSAIAVSSAISGLVMHVGVTKRSGGVLFGLACVGGYFFVMLTGVLYQLLGAELGDVGSTILVSATFAAALSIPCGMLFGLLFIGMLAPVQMQLESPAQDSLAQTARALARVFAVASVLAVIAVTVIEGPYCITFFSVLSEAFDYQAPEGTDIAWTRFLIGVPLLLAALTLGIYAHLQERKFRLLRAALGRRDANIWSISDLTPTVTAMPLTEADRSASHKLLLEGAHADLDVPNANAYRHHAKQAPVYIGIIEAHERPQ